MNGFILHNCISCFCLYIYIFLQENIRIKECNLAWNGLGTIGGVAIADALTANEALTNLDISGNRIDSHATELIGKALAKNDLIKVLKVSTVIDFGLQNIIILNVLPKKAAPLKLLFGFH